MLDITGADIASLNDTDLRTLIGLLCEAEARQHGHSAAAVTWGGSQTAKDGGLDVRVDLKPGSSGLGFIPRAVTGFQVKKPDMPRSEIIKEMQPAGTLRPVIAELAAASGSYIIISSSGSTSDTALKDRRKAIRDALAGHPTTAALHTDFYDRNRVASWVREHAGLIPWVRERIGRAIPGWEAFGSWSRPPAGAKPNYLVDDKARVRDAKAVNGEGVDIGVGINRIRDVLRTPARAARLVGLSGVGKTRLAEALFDTEIGVNALDPSRAIYTNMARVPNPPPPVLASDLIAGGARAILVVDNCSAELHRELAVIVCGSGSTLSVLTIEYDIREDQPEGTDVFVVESASANLIEMLVAQRFPELSQTDRKTVAEFSGGNARIALAVAGTIGRGETIAGLKDQELFERLFNQRHGSDPGLLRIAQACALVYSFDGERLEDEGAELPVLGALIGRSAAEVYEAVAELQRRELVQARGEWRAVLPHAIANRLAALALQNIPPKLVHAHLVADDTFRLRRSFSRRLGFLDGSKEARAIAKQWLEVGGCLHDIAALDELERAMLVNIAPLAPEMVLANLEAAASDPAQLGELHSREMVRLTRSLAYETSQFERAVGVLIRLDTEGNAGNADVTKVLSSLFTIALSGTHAPIEMRLRVAKQMLDSSELAQQKLGVDALKATLETDLFHSDFEFDFGARSRDYGYFPRNADETKDWFRHALALAEAYALGHSPVASEVRSVLVEQFRGLWTSGYVYDDLERICAAIAGLGFWPEGWREARHTLVFAGAGLASEDRDRLVALEQRLRPHDLIDQVRGMVLNGSGRAAGVYDLDDLDDIESARSRTEAAIKDLGVALALDTPALESLLPELITGRGRVAELGAALGASSEEPRPIWLRLVDAVVGTERPNVAFLCGFLHGVQGRDPAAVAEFLDATLSDTSMVTHFPRLQSGVVIDGAGLARLHESLRRKAAPIAEYNYLAWGRACDPIPRPALKRLVIAIAREPDGFPVALDILSMQLHAAASDKRENDPEIIEAGKELLSLFIPSGKGFAQHRQTHELERVAKVCLADTTSADVACGVALKLRNAVAERAIYSTDYAGLLRHIFASHPIAVLNTLFPDDADAHQSAIGLLDMGRRSQRHPLDVVPDDAIVAWCDDKPHVRYPLITKLARLYVGKGETSGLQFTPLARALLARSPDTAAALQTTISRVNFPSGWSGSLANVLDARLKLINTLDVGPRAELVLILDKAKSDLARWIESARQNEAEEARLLGDSFE